MQLPRPWEIAMDWGGHFFLHAATLQCVKEVSKDDFRKLDYSYGGRNYLPEITPNVCSYRVDERGWCDYASPINHPWEDEFKGFHEGKEYAFGSDMMWRNLSHWMKAYMRDGDEQQLDGFLYPDNFFEDLKELGCVFTKPKIYGNTEGQLSCEYTIKCSVDERKIDGATRIMLFTHPTKGNDTKLFFRALAYDYDTLYEAVLAQYNAYNKYIDNLSVKFIPDTFVDGFTSDKKPIEKDIDINPDVLEHLNSITNRKDKNYGKGF